MGENKAVTSEGNYGIDLKLNFHLRRNLTAVDLCAVCGIGVHDEVHITEYDYFGMMFGYDIVSYYYIIVLSPSDLEDSTFVVGSEASFPQHINGVSYGRRSVFTVFLDVHGLPGLFVFKFFFDFQGCETYRTGG